MEWIAIMIGRASIGYPSILRNIKQYMATGIVPDPPSIDERVEVARKHLMKSIEWKGKQFRTV